MSLMKPEEGAQESLIQDFSLPVLGILTAFADDIIADLARYRKPAVLDTHQIGLLAATHNEIAKHVDTRQDLAIKPVPALG